MRWICSTHRPWMQFSRCFRSSLSCNRWENEFLKVIMCKLLGFEDVNRNNYGCILTMFCICICVYAQNVILSIVDVKSVASAQVVSMLEAFLGVLLDPIEFLDSSCAVN